MVYAHFCKCMFAKPPIANPNQGFMKEGSKTCRGRGGGTLEPLWPSVSLSKQYCCLQIDTLFLVFLTGIPCCSHVLQ